ncbi:hypothetical protein ACP275_14G193200 [Erythranthe tilingii]
MLETLHLVTDPYSLLNPNVKMNISLHLTQSFFPIHTNSNSQSRADQSKILCAANRRNRYGIGKSGKLILDSAFIIATKLRLLPEPLELLLREFGSGNGGGNWVPNRFGWGGFDGWRRRRRRKTKLGIIGFFVIFGAVGLWFLVGKELALDGDALFGGLGLLLFGFSVEGWRRGVKDWILGFCCCAFLMGFAFKKDELQKWGRYFETLIKKGRRRRRRRAF